MSDDRAPPAAPPAGGVCPFRGVMQRVGLSPRDPADAKEGHAATPPGVCPFSGAKSGGGDASMASEPSTSTAPGGSGGGGVCPLGFGRSKPGGPPLSRLHCPRCKSLFHDCVLLGCGHRFCASCLGGKATDCCLVCGADVSSRLPDAESQALADAALEDAARADREGQAQAWLRAAMSSAAGGNHAAALARAERAAAALEEELLASCSSSSSASSSSHPPSSAAAARRAAVSGVIGDSHRSLGDLEAAAARYEGAVAVLEGALAEASKVGEGGGGGEKRGDGEGGNPHSDPSSSSSSSSSASPPSSSSSSLRELTRALTVTLNKLGDLRYSSASATEARPFYARALRERLAAAGVGEEQAARAASSGSGSSASSSSSAAIPPASEGDAERASDLIDAGLSAAKVADADAAAAGEGGGEEGSALAEAAERGLRLAAALLAAGAAGAAAAGGPLAARAERLRAFLEGSNGQGK